jgi:hypothetical protein
MFHYLDFHHICFTWTNFTQNKVQIFEALKVWVFFLLATQTHILLPTTKTQTTPNIATRTTSETPRNHHHFLKLTPEIYFYTYIPSPKTYVQWNFICIRRKNKFPLRHSFSISPHHTTTLLSYYLLHTNQNVILNCHKK